MAVVESRPEVGSSAGVRAAGAAGGDIEVLSESWANLQRMSPTPTPSPAPPLSCRAPTPQQHRRVNEQLVANGHALALAAADAAPQEAACVA